MGVGPPPDLTTSDYTVVMARPVSLRFKDPDVAERLRSEASSHGRSTSALAEELLDEGLRTRRHPLIAFRDGAAGRRAVLAGGPDVWEVIAGLVGGDAQVDDRIDRAVELFALTRAHVMAALAYYADFAEEIDGEITANDRAAQDAEAQWRRQRDLLAR